MKKTFILLLQLFFLTVPVHAQQITTATAQESNATWWENYNRQYQSLGNTFQSGSNSGAGRKAIATKSQVGLNIDYLGGKAGEDFDAGIGYNIGLSWDFLYNKPMGIELGMYYNQYGLTFGGTSNGHFSAKLRNMEFQLLFNPRILIGNTDAFEFNFGLGANLGLEAPVKYSNGSDSGDLKYDLYYGNKNSSNSDGVLKDYSTMLLYGLSYSWEDGYLRMMFHDGLTNIAKVGSEKAKLWNFEISIGIVW